MQRVFLFDLNKCTGCEACQLACSIENNVQPHTSWREVYTFNPAHVAAAPSFHLSLACNHCLDPPCMKHCPANAYRKSAATGAVLIDADKCIGCRYCAWACPFDAPRYNQHAGLMEKCTFCEHRLSEGKLPACVMACPTGALKVVDHGSEQGTPHVLGFPDTGVDAAIRFVPLRTDDRERKVSSGSSSPRAIRRVATGSKVTLSGEWPLLVFTLCAAFVTGWMTAPPETRWPPLVLGLSGMLLSTFHLGRPHRAWRALLNWRHSWLSREVLLFGLFVAGTAGYLFSGLGSPVGRTDMLVKWSVVAIGAAALVAIDNVYSVTGTRGLRLHSAGAVLTGLLFAGWFAGVPPLISAIILFKLVLYLARKYRFARERRTLRPVASALRIGSGLLASTLLSSPGPGSHGIALAFLLLGEIVDRVEFYQELEIPSPRTQMKTDLETLGGPGTGSLE